MKDVQDRHVLIELGGDFTNDEMRHILNHAYLNHKAPHEYDELKKYIKDIVIGKHNSPYIMNNGNPEPLASALVLASPYISNSPGSIYYDFCGSTELDRYLFVTNNSSNCNSSTGQALTLDMYTLNYNNGIAPQWGLLYTSTPCPNNNGGLFVSLPNSNIGTNFFGAINATFGYAPYVSSTNPLILTTYFYWNPGGSSLSYSNVYFVITINWQDNRIEEDYVDMTFIILPIFYSAGQYNFNADTYYITMWQWTYS